MLKVATGRSQERESWRRRANINMRLITLSIRFRVFPFCLSVSRRVFLHIFLVNYKILNLKGWMEMEKSHEILMGFFAGRSYSVNITGAHICWIVMETWFVWAPEFKHINRRPAALGSFVCDLGVDGSSPEPEGWIWVWKWESFSQGVDYNWRLLLNLHVSDSHTLDWDQNTTFTKWQQCFLTETHADDSNCPLDCFTFTLQYIFSLLPVERFIHWDCFVASNWVLERSDFSPTWWN